MRLLENTASESLTDREREMLLALGQCVYYLADLNGSNWIGGDSAAAQDMRQRAAGLQRIALNCIQSDPVLNEAWYGA